jgi:hypothetical protein
VDSKACRQIQAFYVAHMRLLFEFCTISEKQKAKFVPRGCNKEFQSVLDYFSDAFLGEQLSKQNRELVADSADFIYESLLHLTRLLIESIFHESPAFLLTSTLVMFRDVFVRRLVMDPCDLLLFLRPVFSVFLSRLSSAPLVKCSTKALTRIFWFGIRNVERSPRGRPFTNSVKSIFVPFVDELLRYISGHPFSHKLLPLLTALFALNDILCCAEASSQCYMDAPRFLEFVRKVAPWMALTSEFSLFCLDCFELSPDLLNLSVSVPVLINAIRYRPERSLRLLTAQPPVRFLHASNFSDLCASLRQLIDDQRFDAQTIGDQFDRHFTTDVCTYGPTRCNSFG